MTWEYRVAAGGLMRCCTESLDRAMFDLMSAGQPQPEAGSRVKCQWHDMFMIRTEDGVWRWDHP